MLWLILALGLLLLSFFVHTVHSCPIFYSLKNIQKKSDGDIYFIIYSTAVFIIIDYV